jgi:hypothetical protein
VLFSLWPHVMMRAAQTLADRLAIPHYVSLENRMAAPWRVPRVRGADEARRREPVSHGVSRRAGKFEVVVFRSGRRRRIP